MAERDRRGVMARIDRTDHVPVPINVTPPYEEIIDAACDAWNRLIALPATITSIGMRGWAHTGRL